MDKEKAKHYLEEILSPTIKPLDFREFNEVMEYALQAIDERDDNWDLFKQADEQHEKYFYKYEALVKRCGDVEGIANFIYQLMTEGRDGSETSYPISLIVCNEIVKELSRKLLEEK